MKKFLVSTAALGIMLASSATATAGDIGVSVSTDYVSEYVFRGISFANSAVQPGIEVSKGGFSLGAWASVPLGSSSAFAADEIDIYGGYGFDLTDLVSASVGFTIFHFPQFGEGLFDFGGASSFEINAGLALDTVLSPALTGYYDFDLDTFTLEGSVGHGFAVSDNVSFDLGVTAGLVTGDSEYEWGTGSASLSYGFDDESSMYVGANFSINSEDNLDFLTNEDLLDLAVDNLDDALALDSFTTDDSVFWVGTGFSTSF